MKPTGIPHLKMAVLSLLALLTPCTLTLAQRAPWNLRCCDKTDPVGTDDRPWFGWYMDDPDDEERQSAYQVLVASSEEKLNEADADQWNSGMVASGMQNYIYYQGDSLKAATRYYWTVRYWDRDGHPGPYAEPALFCTGLFTGEDWSGARWIRRDNSDRDDYTYFRRQFEVADKAVARATVYLTAVHEYQLYLNGALVGKGPGYHYPQYQYYNAYDITDGVAAAEDHQFACLTHWYGKGQGRPASARGFLLKAVIEYEDSTVTVIGTDSTWKQQAATAWLPGQSTRNGEGVGYKEKIDAAQLIPGWNTLQYNDSSWAAAAEIGPHPVAPWTGTLQPNLARLVESEIAPVSVSNIGEGRYVIDLGKVYAGVPRITFSGGEPGTVVSVRGGYTLEEDGTVSTRTDQQTDMVNYFVLDGGPAVFQPMVYLGMRYLQVEHSPIALTTENCRFITRHYELDPSRSAFQSSDYMLKQVWDLMKHSLILGSQESFVDTPTREKGGFLGDSWSIGVPAMTTMGDRVMNRRILLEFLDSQDQYWPDGRLNAVYPNGDGKRDIPDYTQMYLVWAWDYYMQTGDQGFLRDNYGRLKKVADYVDAYRHETTGLIHKLEGGGGAYLHGIVDWPEQMRYGYDMEVESRTVVDAYAYMDFEVIARVAEVLDSIGDRDLYRQKALDMKDAINQSLINEEGVYIDGLYADLSRSDHVSQHANMFPMAMGLVPEEHRDSVVKAIRDREMSVGMVTLRWLPEAVGQAGEGPHLLELYTNTEWDGWAQTLALGGTATWESWDAITNEQSLSHPWGAVGLLGIQQYILGITPLKPQHEQILVRPLDFEQQLSHVNGTLPTDRGEISIRWTRSDTLFSMTLNIPDNVSAKVYVPGSGTEGTLVLVDDEEISGTEEGKHIYVGEYGSGEHTFVRSAAKVGPAVRNRSARQIHPISIYPNPGADRVLVDLGRECASVDIRVRDITGSVVSEGSFTGAQFCPLGLEGMEPGIYLVTVTDRENEPVTLRLVKH